MKIHYSILAVLLSMPLIQADFIRIPKQLETLPVFHIQRAPVKDINACYRALFDACNIEELCGISTKFSDYTIFFSHLKAKKINYQATKVILNEMPVVAKQQFGLSVFCVNSSGYFSSTPFAEDLGKGLSGVEYPHAISQAIQKEHEQCIEKINKLLLNPKQEPVALHFLFAATATSPLALISLVQTKKGRVLYVSNENNIPMGMSLLGTDTICACVSGLAKKFSLGTLADFKLKHDLASLSFPYLWPSIPQSFEEKIDPYVQFFKGTVILGGLCGFGYGVYALSTLMSKK